MSVLASFNLLTSHFVSVVRVGREVVVGLGLVVVQAATAQQHHLVRVYPERIDIIFTQWKDSFVSFVCLCNANPESIVSLFF